MAYSYFCGWDVSKSTLNYHLCDLEGRLHCEGQIANTLESLKQLLKRFTQDYGASVELTLHGAENTGQYTNRLYQLSQECGAHLWVQDALHLHKSLGRQRDKSDQIDAGLIADYIRRHSDQACLYQLPSKFLLKLKSLYRLRKTLVKTLQRTQTSYREMKEFELVSMDEQDTQIIEQHIDQTRQQLRKLEQRIEECFAQADETVKRRIEIARSIPGIGPKNVLSIMVITGNFERIPSAEKCASYAGICPHIRQSGTSLRARFRSSRSASRELKTAFHQGAMSLIRGDNPFNSIYRRLREKGRSHKQAINAVRNKIITVLYACLKNDSTYCKKRHLRLQML